MQSTKSGLSPLVIVLLVVATCASLFAAYKRFHIEESNRRVEIALEWQEIAALAQADHREFPPDYNRIDDILTAMKAASVTTVVISEDTITTLEQSGAIRPTHESGPDVPIPSDSGVTIVTVDSESNLQRISAALKLRGLRGEVTTGLPAAGTRTIFYWSLTPPQSPQSGAAPPPMRPSQVATTADYANLRTMGLGLPPDVVKLVQKENMRIAGRISNFAGVTADSALAALKDLGDTGGASTVIFNGEEVLGWRGLEPEVAKIFSTGKKAPIAAMPGQVGVFQGIPEYGAVEFGKQKGDEKLQTKLQGQYVRVHSIQAAEMGQMNEEEAIDRFVRAAKERNIRFCYVRLSTFAGKDPVGENVKFLNKITHGMSQGSMATGGGLQFGAARQYEDTGLTDRFGWLFAVIALGAAAGTVWMLVALAPMANSRQILLAIVLGLLCAGAAVFLQETGRKLVAFLAGIVFPTIACLVTYPGRSEDKGSEAMPSDLQAPPGMASPAASLAAAFRTLSIASLITAVGIIQVVGLLASRPFMMRANQFLGIKAQHAIPLLIIALVAIAGGVVRGETWERLFNRAKARLGDAMAEPARFGTLALGIIAIAALILVVARTGNDAGVGVSGTELSFRAFMDRILPVRPRTKEFLVGHPAFVLAIAWWWRGRRRLAIPAFVVGSLGQVSLLNTFCHIHTPLIISIWRDGLGLLLGALIGSAIFLAVEAAFSIGRRKPATSTADRAVASARTAEKSPQA